MREIMGTTVKKHEIDMLHGSIWNKLPLFALPVAATAILEQLFHASDVAIVGNFTGDARTVAVAAVGANGPIIGLIVNLFIGIALGANVVIANAIGCRDDNAVKRAVHTAIVFAVCGGAAVALLGQLIASPLLSILNVPEDVFPETSCQGLFNQIHKKATKKVPGSTFMLLTLRQAGHLRPLNSSSQRYAYSGNWSI